ncbi:MULTISPECIES: DNA primase [unclassified Staphylococcus]|uniref:DNA primase n=1 Tax=unclassified Staphylococcus TaxID=91994 RepID=UPI0021CFECFE|nr:MULTISPECIES: DNA primase [unclassified Staphylococcus]UXR75239.1 DNA primase [Staphylococcus sp. IVB6233]UXR79439.1 DNA primase [Staphylococcus sp. IVB6218]
MRIPQATIDEIKQNTDILDVVSEYVKLEKRGRNYIGLCPFHDEKTPSFTVSEDKQICHCFGCKKGGNVFQFIQEIEKVSFAEAVKKLGERANIKVQTEMTQQTNNIASDDLKMIQIHEELLDYYHYLLKKTVEGEAALNYLYSRGFTDEMIAKRKIGYAPDASSFATDYMEKKGYDLSLGFEAGILSRNESNFSYYDRFRNRIIFPLANAQGRVIGYSGRAYHDDQTPKYLNSPESPIFQKRKLLYNLDKARKSIRQKDEIILLEGFMDVIKTSEAGLENVVASMGTQISREHITVLKKLCQNVTLMFDGDFAGTQATIKTGQTLLEQHFDVFVIQMPAEMDPDEYIEKYGSERFLEFVNNEKKSFVSFKLKQNQQEIQNNDLAYENHYKAFINDASYIQSNILRQKVIQEAALLFNVAPNSLLNEVERISPKSGNQYTQMAQPVIQPIKLSKNEKAERAILKHFFNDKALFLRFYQDIEETDFTNEHFKRIFNVLQDYYAEHAAFTISDIFEYIDNDDVKETVIQLVDYPLNHEPYEHEMLDYISVMTFNRSDESLESLQTKLNEAIRIGDSDAQKYYLEQIVNKKREQLGSKD